MKTEIFFMLVIPGIIIFAVIASSILTLYDCWKHYKIIYKQLPNMKFIVNHNQVYGNNNDFIYFTGSNGFKLCNYVYLHNAAFTWCDPYSFYWLRKYQRWFKNNVEINKLPEWNAEEWLKFIRKNNI